MLQLNQSKRERERERERDERERERERERDKDKRLNNAIEEKSKACINLTEFMVRMQ